MKRLFTSTNHVTDYYRNQTGLLEDETKSPQKKRLMFADEKREIQIKEIQSRFNFSHGGKKKTKKRRRRK